MYLPMNLWNIENPHLWVPTIKMILRKRMNCCLQRSILLHFQWLQFLLIVNQPFLATQVYFYSTLINKFAINLFSQLSLLVILNKYWKLNRTGSWRKIFAKIKVLIWRILNLFPNLNRLIFVFDLKRGVSISSFAAAG